MRPRPGPTARAKLAQARARAALRRVEALHDLVKAGLRAIARPDLDLQEAQALAGRLQAMEHAFAAETAQPTPVGPSSTRRTRRTRSARR